MKFTSGPLSLSFGQNRNGKNPSNPIAMLKKMALNIPMKVLVLFIVLCCRTNATNHSAGWISYNTLDGREVYQNKALNLWCYKDEIKENWFKDTLRDGTILYHNVETGETTKEKPESLKLNPLDAQCNKPLSTEAGRQEVNTIWRNLQANKFKKGMNVYLKRDVDQLTEYNADDANLPVYYLFAECGDKNDGKKWWKLLEYVSVKWNKKFKQAKLHDAKHYNRKHFKVGECLEKKEEDLVSQEELRQQIITKILNIQKDLPFELYKEKHLKDTGVTLKKLRKYLKNVEEKAKRLMSKRLRAERLRAKKNRTNSVRSTANGAMPGNLRKKLKSVGQNNIKMETLVLTRELCRKWRQANGMKMPNRFELMRLVNHHPDNKSKWMIDNSMAQTVISEEQQLARRRLSVSDRLAEYEQHF